MPKNSDFERAERLLQNVYTASIEDRSLTMDMRESIRDVGVMALHDVYYNSGLVVKMIEELQRNPYGPLVKLIRALRDLRSGDYSKETLDKIYGLKDLLD